MKYFNRRDFFFFNELNIHGNALDNANDDDEKCFICL